MINYTIFFKNIKKLLPIIKFLTILFVCILVFSQHLEASVTIKIDVKNPSESKVQVVPVKQYLPIEAKPKNVINSNGMNVRYDSEQSRYFVYADIELQPGQSKTFKIEIEDIWLVPDKEINYLRLHAQGMLEILKDTPYKDMATGLVKNVNRWLDVVINKQIESESDTQEHIKAYRYNLDLLDSIRTDINTLEGMIADYVDISDYKVQEELLEAITLDKSLFFTSERGESVTFKIGISNPSKIKLMKWPLKYYLPKEVKEEQILSKGELELRYDFDKALYYLHKNVELQPQEEKIFNIEVEDVWSIDVNKFIVLRQHTHKLTGMLAQTEYVDAANLMASSIIDNIGKIESSQNEARNLEDRIGTYRINRKLMADIRKDVARLEKLVIQSQRASSFGLVPADKAGSEADKEKLGEPGLKIIGESYFKGTSPAKGTTWKIIFFIIGFLGLISGVFFFYNYSIERRESHDQLSGAATRSYFVKEVNKYLWEAPEDKKVRLYFLLIDIDRFKEINDGFGHDVGDIFIRNVGVAIAQSIKNPLAFGRLGGDEFAIVTEAANQNEVTDTAGNILRNFRMAKTTVGTKDISTTVSIGISNFSRVEDFHSLYKKADNALYRAKDAGRNTFSL